MALLSFLFGVSTTPLSPEYVHVCNRDWSEKSLEVKVELAIGCSRVGRDYTYSNYKLEIIFKEEK